MRITKEKTVALLIDFQERLFPAMNSQESLLERCTLLLNGINILGLPVLVTQQYTKGLGSTLPNIASLISGFEPIEKTTFSCYNEPIFKEQLEQSNAVNVIIAGIEAHVCVLQTAIDLKEAGYNPIVISDCISSRSKKEKKVAMNRFNQENILVSSAESILFELLGSASSSEFKAISKLVK